MKRNDWKVRREGNVCGPYLAPGNSYIIQTETNRIGRANLRPVCEKLSRAPKLRPWFCKLAQLNVNVPHEGSGQGAACRSKVSSCFFFAALGHRQI